MGETIDAVGYGSALLGARDEPLDLLGMEQAVARATSDDERSDSTNILLGVPESRAARRPPLPTGTSLTRTRGAASESASFTAGLGAAHHLNLSPLPPPANGIDGVGYSAPLELSISTSPPPKSALTRSYTPSHTYLGSSTALSANYNFKPHSRSGTASSALTPPAAAVGAPLNKFSMSTLALSAPAAAKPAAAFSSESELSDLELDSKAASRGRGTAAAGGHHLDYVSKTAYGGGAHTRTASQSGLASHYLSHTKYGASGGSSSGRNASHSPAPSSNYFASSTALSKTPIPLASHYIDRPAMLSASGARSASPSRSYTTSQSRGELERQGRETALSRLNLSLAADDEAMSPAFDAFGRSASPMGRGYNAGAADSFTNASAGGGGAQQQKPFAPRTPADVHMGDFIKFCRHGGRVSRGRVMFIGSLPGRHDVYLGVELENEGVPASCLTLHAYIDHLITICHVMRTVHIQYNNLQYTI